MNDPLVSDTTPLLATVEVQGSPKQVTPWTVAERWEELCTLSGFAMPVFACVKSCFLIEKVPDLRHSQRTSILEYSLVMVPVISIGHLSTTALAAMSLGSMTANVTAFSMIRGFASALDAMLPSAWTSSQPQLVGLWSQRMGVVMIGLQIPIFVLWFNAYGILLALRQDPEVAALAATYLRWLSLGLPGQYASEWWAWELVALAASLWAPPPVRSICCLTGVRKIGAFASCSSINYFDVLLDDVTSSVCAFCGYFCSVSIGFRKSGKF
ncbi:hypothetical protein DXG01_012684 [Tephrocybe rancida]|nr:hypothetical protein DXG01_012684 [Tephrocybe rancida]